MRIKYIPKYVKFELPVDGDYFESLANIKWENNPDSFLSNLSSRHEPIVYCATHEANSMLKILNNYNKKNVIIITHNSDGHVDNGQIREDSANVELLPGCVSQWYAQNLRVNHKIIHPLPIGLERQRWFPWKRKLLMGKREILKRKGVLVSFNTNTNKKERDHIMSLFDGKKFATVKQTRNGSDFTEYIKDLKTHKFIVCPAGNGIDTHRIWEGVQMGCTPIVDAKTFKPEIYTSLFKKYGIITVDNFENFVSNYAED